MTTQLYTELDLRKLRGQALKDVWHKMIGKPPGLHNTTGLHNSEEILQAILQGQKDPEYLNRFTKQHKQKDVDSVVEMPPQEKKKPGPKPKPKPDQNPIVIPLPSTALRILAVESMEEPQKKMEVERIKLTRLHIGSESYFLDRASNTVYAMENNKPGSIYGSWDPVARTVQADS
jgi:hypothetical protein